MKKAFALAALICAVASIGTGSPSAASEAGKFSPHQEHSPPLCGALAVLACLVAVSGAGGAGSAADAPSFAPGPSLPVGTAPSAVAVGDFDGDGSPDLVVGNTGDPSENFGGYRSNLRVLLNGGTGRFHMAPGSPFKIDAGSFAVGDFNNDGKGDLAVAGENLRVLLGDGTGRFTDAPGSPVPFGGLVINAGDLNGDRIPDLAGAIGIGNGVTLRILLGDGSGRFTVFPAVPPVTVSELASLNVADLNGDGKADLVVADGKTNRISTLLGDGTGAFGQARRFAPGAKIAGKLVAGDFNGDGSTDLALPVSDTQAIAVLFGNGSGGFRTAPRTPVTGGAYQLAVADFDADGKADLASTGYAGISVLAGRGEGRFRPVPFSPFPVLWDFLIAVADFNADTRTDILVVGGGIPEWPVDGPQDVVLFQTASEPRPTAGRMLPRGDATFSTRSIRVLAADANRAAACTKKRLVVWTAPRGRTRNFRADCYYDLALGGGRVAWLQFFAWPNEPEMTIRVYSHRLSGGPLQKLGRALNYAEHNDLRGSWLGQLLGAGPLLAFNHWDVDCLLPPGRDPSESGGECENENPTFRIFGQELHILAGRSRRVKRGRGFYPLRAVGGGRLAVAPGGEVVVLAPNGARVATVQPVDGDPPRGIALGRTRLAVLRTSTLDLYNPADGAKQATFPLGSAAALRLAGVNSKVALLDGPQDLVLVRLRDGKLISFPLGSVAAKHLVDAKLTAAGLFYAYNDPRRTKPGRLVFEPIARLLARF
jgi:hypothetical protein